MSRLSDRMERVRKLKNGFGVQALLDEAYKILGNPIVMFDTEYSLLAYTDVVTDDPIWNELVTCGRFSKETQKFFETEGFIEEVANAATIAVLQSQALKYDRVFGKIFNKNMTYVSSLLMVACEKALEEHDSLVFEVVCKLLSREIRENMFYQEYEQTHLETIVKNLVDGNYDIKQDMAQVGILYDSMESNLYILVVDPSQCKPEYRDIKFLRDLLKQTEPDHTYAIYSNYIIIIVSSNADDLHVTRQLCELIQMFDQYNLYAGISSRFENLFDLNRYYSEAHMAMQCALAVKSSQRIFPCHENSREKMEQIKRLTNGEGIQHFLNIGPEIFGNPLLFHDMELNLLAYTEHMEICDPIWEELIAYGTGSNETINLFKSEGFINVMQAANGGAFLISKNVKYDHISWKIYSSDDLMIGCLSIVNTFQPFSEDELVLFGAFSQKFSKEVGKIEFCNHYGQVYSGTVINRLLSGKIDDYTFYSEGIGNLYDNLMEHLYLIVIDTAQCESEQVNLTYFRNLFNWPGTVNRYAIYAGHIIVIISVDCAPLSEKKEMQEICQVFERNHIYAGISSGFGNIFELQKYYAEAVGALEFGKKNIGKSGKQRIFQQEEPTDDKCLNPYPRSS